MSNNSNSSITALDDFFKPLCLDQARVPANNKPKKECAVRSPRKRSIQFADEKQNARFMLETVLLFEPEDSFSEGSFLSLMDDSCASFDSYEYAHGGNCPSPTSVNMEQFTQEDPSKVPPVIMAAIQQGPSSEEIMQQVREQQAQEFAEKSESNNNNNNNKRVSAPAILMTTTTTEPVAPMEAARQKLKAEKLKAARQEEAQKVLEQAAKERQKTQQQQQQQQQPTPVAPKRASHSRVPLTRQEVLKRRASYEQAALQKQQEEEQSRANREKELRKIREERKAEEEKAKANKAAAAAALKKQQQLEQEEKKAKEEEKAAAAAAAATTKSKAKTTTKKETTANKGRNNKKQDTVSTTADTRSQSPPASSHQRMARESKAARVWKHHEDAVQARKDKDAQQLQTKANVQSARQRMAQRDAELLQKARDDAIQRQQLAKEEALSLKGVFHNASSRKDTTELTAAHNAKLAMEKRKHELEDVGTKSLVGANIYNRRQRSVVRIQAAARRFIILRRLRRYKRYVASKRIQKVVRGFLVRNDMDKLQSKIASLEEHLNAMEEDKQEELKSIRNNPELAEVIDQLDDAVAIRKQRELKKERLELRRSISEVKDNNDKIAQSMENLRINNRKIAKHTRYLEDQIPIMQQRIRILEKTHNQLQEKNDRLSADVHKMKRETDQAGRKFESESRVADLAHDTILRIRACVKLASETSNDTFLRKIRKRSKILERINPGGGGPEKRHSVQSCPLPIMSR